jgi:two-component system, chemotaxis family, sensor kinase CheA
MQSLRERLMASFLVEAREHLAVARRWLEQGAPHEAQDDVHRRLHSLKGAARAAGRTAIEQVAHEVEDLLAGDVQGAALRSSIAERLDRIEMALNPASAGQAMSTPSPLARVDVRSLDQVLLDSSTLLGLCHSQLGTVRDLRWTFDELARLVPGRLPREVARRLRSLLDQQRQSAWRANQVSQRLRKDVQKARLESVEAVFGDLRASTLALLQAAGSKAELRVVGMETRADRQVLQALRDPVLHLLRNAVTHGIGASGGRIELAFSNPSDYLRVEVTDSGTGPDPALLSGVVGTKVSDEALLAVLVRPGVTSRGEGDLLAGRGMGLAAVQAAATELQGTLSMVRSSTGCCFAVQVPLSKVTVRAITVRCGGELFAFPLDRVERIDRLTMDSIIRVDHEHHVQHSSRAAPYRDLATLVGAEAEDPVWPRPAVLLRHGETRWWLSVDELVDVREETVAVLRSLRRAGGRWSGVIIRDDGETVLMARPEILWQLARERSPQPRAAKAAQHRRTPEVLVVDDSLTTRTLEQGLLETCGYRVRCCVDGLDALEAIGQRRPDLVIADIEMPRMDGFELLGEIRRRWSRPHLPVVIVSSRHSEADQRKGLQLGADAYVTKQRFDADELINVVARFTGTAGEGEAECAR